MVKDMLERIGNALSEAYGHGEQSPQFLLIGPAAKCELSRDAMNLPGAVPKSKTTIDVEKVYGLEIIEIPWMEGFLVSQWKYPVRKTMNESD